MRTTLLILGLAAALAMALSPNASSEGLQAGKTPPALSVGKNAWLNWQGDLSLDSLRGHLVWLEFSFIQ
jgi:hypothetical protein